MILGLVAMFVFRQPLSRLIDRTRRITKKGLEADAQPQDGKLKITPYAAEELQRLFDNALLVKRENQVRTELERLGFRDQTEREKTGGSCDHPAIRANLLHNLGKPTRRVTVLEHVGRRRN